MTLRAGLALELVTVAVALAVALVVIVWRPQASFVVAPPPATAAPATVQPVPQPVEQAPLEGEGRREASRPHIEGGEGLEADEQEDASLGTLRVLVRSEETAKPLGGVRLFLVPAGDDHWSTTHVEGARGKPGEGPVTGADGLVEFEVPLGQAYDLKARRGQVYDEASDVVPAFTAPETREIVLELPTVHGLPFVGRVVASETDEPVPGASVSIAGGFIEVSTDADGYFEAVVPPGRELHAEVEAPGYGPAIIEVGRGHEVLADALVIRLSLSARLDVLVLARDGAVLEGVEVRLSTESYHLTQQNSPLWFLGDLEWSCSTAADGRCSVTELPAFVPLKVRYEKDRVFRRTEADPIWLAPGEAREIVLRIGSGATITGQLIDETGHLMDESRQDAAGVELWLTPAETGTPHYFREFGDNPAARTKTNPSGQFEFADVADGTWWVGPSPESPFVPRAEFVDVIDGVVDRRVLLELTRGLFIKGGVVDRAGAPIEGACAFVSSEKEQVWLSGDTDAVGRFTIGPLARGTFLVQAMGTFIGYVDSEPISVQAGDEDLLIELHPGGVLRGTLVEGAELKNGRVILTAAGNAEPWWSGWKLTWTDETGAFLFQGLEPGLYHVAASTDGEGFAMQRDVAVAPGSEAPGVVLEAEPGARLLVRYEGSQRFANFRAKLGEVVVAGDGIERGASSTQVVPAGTLRVECQWPGLESPEVHEVTLAVGEEKKLVFGKPE